jgi:hypothetical protein
MIGNRFLTLTNGLTGKGCSLHRPCDSCVTPLRILQWTIKNSPPWSRVNDVLTKLHGGPSGGHLGFNKTPNTVRQRYYWLQARNDAEKCCQQYNTMTPVQPVAAPRTRNWGQIHQYNIGDPFERTAINVAGTFPWSDQGNRYLLITMDYFTKWPHAYAIPNQEASTVAEVLVTNFFCHFRVPWELQWPGLLTLSPIWYREFYNAWDWARRAPHPCTHSQTAWWNDASKRLRSTYEKPSLRTRGIGT